MRKDILVLALFLMSLASVSANPHPIVNEKGRSLDINDYDIDSIRYNGPFWDPELNVRAWKMGGEGRLVRSKQGVDPVFYAYPSYGRYYPHYPSAGYYRVPKDYSDYRYYDYYNYNQPRPIHYPGYDFPMYGPGGYVKYHGYSVERYNSFNDCPTITANHGFYSDTYINCGRNYYPY